MNPHSNKKDFEAGDKASAQCNVENQDFLKAVKVQCGQRWTEGCVVMLHWMPPSSYLQLKAQPQAIHHQLGSTKRRCPCRPCPYIARTFEKLCLECHACIWICHALNLDSRDPKARHKVSRVRACRFYVDFMHLSPASEPWSTSISLVFQQIRNGTSRRILSASSWECFSCIYQSSLVQYQNTCNQKLRLLILLLALAWFQHVPPYIQKKWSSPQYQWQFHGSTVLGSQVLWKTQG